MLRILLIAVLVFAAVHADAQTRYVMVREGINVYADTTTKSKIITTLPYGTAIEDTFDYVHHQYFYKNYETYFVPVMTKQGKGYVPDACLLPFQPPMHNVSSLDSYFQQLTEPISYPDSVYHTKGDYLQNETDFIRLKTVYKNGIVTDWEHQYYSSYFSALLPDMDIQRAYMLMQYFDEDNEIFPADKVFPDKDSEDKTDQYTMRYITIQKEYERPVKLSIRLDSSGMENRIQFIQVGKDVFFIQTSDI